MATSHRSLGRAPRLRPLTPPREQLTEQLWGFRVGVRVAIHDVPSTMICAKSPGATCRRLIGQPAANYPGNLVEFRRHCADHGGSACGVYVTPRGAASLGDSGCKAKKARWPQRTRRLQLCEGIRVMLSRHIAASLNFSSLSCSDRQRYCSMRKDLHF